MYKKAYITQNICTSGNAFIYIVPPLKRPYAFLRRAGEYSHKLRVLPMYFCGGCKIEYTMRKIKKPKHLLNIFCFALLAAIIISAPFTAARMGKTSAEQYNGMTVLNIWQIDSFEGGKGSRAEYLKGIGAEFTKQNSCYIKVTAVTADAARDNLKSGAAPDLISYGAGMYGIEGYITAQKPYYCWCNGGYCFLTTDENADFADISIKNTVINMGTDNLSGAAALLCGIKGAKSEKPTGAYVDLINGKYKYLLGTQRDIFRLKTRGVAFKIRPVTEFNDLYQNISVTASNAKQKAQAQKFIEFLLSKSATVNKIGLLSAGNVLYDDEMHAMERLNYECKLVSPIGKQTKTEIENAIASGDIKLLKNFLN